MEWNFFNFWVLSSFHLESTWEAIAHAQQSSIPSKQENVTDVSVCRARHVGFEQIGVELKLGHQPVS